MPELRWRELLRWALIGWFIGMTLAVLNLVSTMDTLGGLVDVSPTKPAAGIIAEDFGNDPNMLRKGGDHDGPMFYAVARQPWNFDAVAPSLDRPRYRYQRILFPAVAWALHPTGGGPGLMWTMFAINVVGVFAGALAMGVLSVTLRGPPWAALVFPVLSGAVLSVRITTPDAIAMAFVLWAIVASLRDRRWAAVLCAVGAIGTKEPVFLALIGFAVWRRDRDGALLVGIPAVLAAAWWAFLHTRLGAGEGDLQEFVRPFLGWTDAVEFWRTVDEPLGMVNTIAGIALGVAALVKHRLRHPLSWAVALNLAMTVVLSVSVLGPERNAARAMLPLQVLSVLVLLTKPVKRTDVSRWARTDSRSRPPTPSRSPG